MSKPPQQNRPNPSHITSVDTFGIALTGILGILAVLLPAAIGSTPVAGVEMTRPPWMFWWPFTLENWFGLPAIAWGEVAFFAILAILPFADRNKKRSWRQRPVAMTLASLLLVALIALSIIMILTPAQNHLGM